MYDLLLLLAIDSCPARINLKKSAKEQKDYENNVVLPFDNYWRDGRVVSLITCPL